MGLVAGDTVIVGDSSADETSLAGRAASFEGLRGVWGSYGCYPELFGHKIDHKRPKKPLISDHSNNMSKTYLSWILREKDETKGCQKGTKKSCTATSMFAWMFGP